MSHTIKHSIFINPNGLLFRPQVHICRPNYCSALCTNIRFEFALPVFNCMSVWASLLTQYRENSEQRQQWTESALLQTSCNSQQRRQQLLHIWCVSERPYSSDTHSHIHSDCSNTHIHTHHAITSLHSHTQRHDTHRDTSHTHTLNTHIHCHITTLPGALPGDNGLEKSNLNGGCP